MAWKQNQFEIGVALARQMIETVLCAVAEYVGVGVHGESGGMGGHFAGSRTRKRGPVALSRSSSDRIGHSMCISLDFHNSERQLILPLL